MAGVALLAAMNSCAPAWRGVRNSHGIVYRYTAGDLLIWQSSLNCTSVRPDFWQHDPATPCVGQTGRVAAEWYRTLTLHGAKPLEHTRRVALHLDLAILPSRVDAEIPANGNCVETLFGSHRATSRRYVSVPA